MAEVDYGKLKVAELKDLCRQRSLAVSGTKAVLISRLQGVAPPPKPSGSKATKASKAKAPTVASTASSQIPPPSAPGLSQAPVASSTPIQEARSGTAVPPRVLSVHRDARQSLDSPAPAAKPPGEPPASTSKAPAPSEPAVSLSGLARKRRAPPLVSADPKRPAVLPSILSPPASVSVTSRPDPSPAPIARTKPSFRPPMSSHPRPLPQPPRVAANQRWAVDDHVVALRGIWTRLGPTPRRLEDEIGSVLTPFRPETLVALRYALARLYTTLLGMEDGGLASLPELPSLVSIAEARTGIFVATLSTREEVHFVEFTGEPIGREIKASKSRALDIRQDWRAFLSQSVDGSVRLPDLVQSSDPDLYPHGIGQHFRNRTGPDSALLRCAESYVLANSAPSSISGTWKPLHALACEADPQPVVAPTSFSSAPRVALYVSPAHYVESVSFTSTGNKALHPAVCSIQLAVGRAHVCLRLTGQVVGNEEDGVVDLWRHLLACDAAGVPL